MTGVEPDVGLKLIDHSQLPSEHTHIALLNNVYKDCLFKRRPNGMLLFHFSQFSTMIVVL